MARLPPPEHTRWKPGQSGNPNGRARVELEIRDWIRAKLAAPEEREKLWRRAQKSDFLFKHLLEMAYGNPTQAIQLSGEVTHRYVAQIVSTDLGLDSPEAEQSRPDVRH